MPWIYLASALLGYLLGSFPTGYLVGRRYGIDIREHGSRNMGATNVVRVLGKKPGYLVFFCDAIKGLIAARLAIYLAGVVEWHHYQHVLGSSGIADPDPNNIFLSPEKFQAFVDGVAPLCGILAGLGCILGHNFPVWLRFRGGKGVATTVGVLLGLMPAAFAVAVTVWTITFVGSRYVSLASLLAAASLPLATWWILAPNNSSALPIGGMTIPDVEMSNTQLSMNPLPSIIDEPMFWFSVVAALLIFWRHRANIVRLYRGEEPRFERKSARRRRTA